MPRPRASQDLPSWIGAHVRMLDYFQGSPAIWVPDNLKSGVTTASRYEPEINRTYAELARHYGAVVIPARVATPTDKPQVEVSVQIAQRWVLAALRHRTFFTLADLNAAIRDAGRRDQRPPDEASLGVSRRALFAQLDRPALKPLPRDALRAGGMEAVSRQHRLSRRGRSQLLQRAVSARARAGRGAFHADHRRSLLQGPPRGGRTSGSPAAAGLRRRSTHMPRAHRAHAEWTPSRLIAWAEQTGPATGRRRRGHPRATGRIPSKATAPAWA